MRIVTLIAAATLSCAFAAPMASASGTTTPILNGNYVFQKVENCGGGVMVQQTGTWNFNNAAHTWTAVGYVIKGVPLAMSAISGNGTYTNTPTGVNFNGTSPYNAFYGSLTNGTAQGVNLIALGTGPCGEQFTMSRF